ncbi:MAG: hypothetical protein QOF56_3583 [Acidobacteriaceae bacterium]|nr:hypothetical protein [Acidobacteriaceae bacterium]
MEFSVSMLLRPQIKRNGSEFVDQRLGESVLGEVDGLDVGFAGIAALDPDVRKGFSGVDGQFGMILLAASGTDDASEVPFGEADAAEQAAPASIALRAENGKHRFAITEWAEGMGVAVELQASLRTGEFRIGLQEGQSQKLFWIRGRRARREPGRVQQIRKSARRSAPQTASDLGKEGRPALFNDGKKCWEVCQGFRQVQRIGGASILLTRGWAGRGLDGRGDAGATFCRVLEALVEAFLEAGNVNVKAQYLRGERMLGGEVFGAPDALLPGSFGHRGDYEVLNRSMQPRGLEFHPLPYKPSV